MSDEYWATFSIYDHRHGALYRKSLILFDRVVIPVPTEEVGDLKPKEIEALSKDVEFLERAGVAIRFDWDPREFHEWQRETAESAAVDGEMIAKVLVGDPQYATRLQLTQACAERTKGLLPDGVDSVIAVPV